VVLMAKTKIKRFLYNCIPPISLNVFRTDTIPIRVIKYKMNFIGCKLLTRSYNPSLKQKFSIVTKCFMCGKGTSTYMYILQYSYGTKL
jgi:hypothetical protein